MAYTVSAEPTVFGNKNARLIKVIADAAEGNVTTGFSVIDLLVTGEIQSMATAHPYIQANKNSSGTASNGTIGVSGVSAGAEVHCLVFGR